MKVFKTDEVEYKEIRAHPWIDSVVDPRNKYYNFIECPELIPRVLEDYRAYSEYNAIKHFYDLLKWLNGPDSCFETNDCAFSGIEPNIDENADKTHRCSGRILWFYRSPEYNVSKRHITWLHDAAHFHLMRVRPELQHGIIEISYINTQFLKIPGREEDQLGKSIMTKFWAWGDGIEDVMDNLEELILGMHEGMRNLCKEIKEEGPSS